MKEISWLAGPVEIFANGTQNACNDAVAPNCCGPSDDACNLGTALNVSKLDLHGLHSVRLSGLQIDYLREVEEENEIKRRISI